MVLVRRLSLTLLVVAPLITGQESEEERDPARRTMQDIRDMFGVGLGDWGWGWGQQEKEGEESNEGEDAVEGYRWGRRRRAAGADLETAEQVLFRPIFRHHQLVEDREHRRQLREREGEHRRHYQEPAPPTLAHLALPHVPVVPLQHRYTQGEKPMKAIGFGAVVFRPEKPPSYRPVVYYKPQ